MNRYAALVAPEKGGKRPNNAGRTIEEILRKESECDIYALLGAIEVLVKSNVTDHFKTSQSGSNQNQPL